MGLLKTVNADFVAVLIEKEFRFGMFLAATEWLIENTFRRNMFNVQLSSGWRWLTDLKPNRQYAPVQDH